MDSSMPSAAEAARQNRPMRAWGRLGYHPGMSDDPGMPDDVTQRRHLLTTALVGALLPPDVPEGRMMRASLDSWAGVGHVVESMRAIGYNVRLTQSPCVWWAEFCRDEVNPVPRWIGRAHRAEPWRAVQWAALETLRQEWEARSGEAKAS
jgi:hypothetical protein